MFLLKKTEKTKKTNSKHTDNFEEKGSVKTSSLTLFSRGDLIIYPLLIVFIVILFFILIFPSNNKSYDGFTVMRENKTVFTFTFENSSPININEEFAHLTQVNQTENGYEITVYTSDKSGYNVIYIDTIERTAKVIKTNCSERKDCFHAPALKNNGTIFCNPHDLLIKPTAPRQSAPITG